MNLFKKYLQFTMRFIWLFVIVVEVDREQSIFGPLACMIFVLRSIRFGPNVPFSSCVPPVL